jgi:signal transduction histidine kinase
MNEADRVKEIIAHVKRVRHDAASPLTAALGNVQLLLEDPQVPEGEVRDTLRVVEGELRKLAALLRQLSDIREEGGTGTL